MDQLLRERSQQIDLAKIICPVYDKKEINWEMVDALTTGIQKVKNGIMVVKDVQATMMTINNKSSQLSNEFIESIFSSNYPKMNAATHTI